MKTIKHLVVMIGLIHTIIQKNNTQILNRSSTADELAIFPSYLVRSSLCYEIKLKLNLRVMIHLKQHST